MLIALVGVFSYLLNILSIVIIAQFVLSLLVSFNVVNTYNEFVGGLMRALNIITEPLYRPIRRLLPDLGGIDFSPMVVIIIIQILQRLLAGLQTDLMLGYG